MDLEKDTPKKKSLLRQYWWLMLFFLLPFLAVGGFSGVLKLHKMMEAVGRDGGKMDLFHPEAIQSFFSGLFQYGITPGLIGLSLGIIGVFLVRIMKKVFSQSNETSEQSPID